MARKHIGRMISGGTYIMCVSLLLSMNGNALGFGGAMKKFMISGNTGAPDVILKGFPGATIQSDNSGNYSVEVSYNWSGQITPQKAGFQFNPATHTVEPVKANVTGLDFFASAQMYTISGSAIAGAVLDGFLELVTADEKGLYKAFVPYGWTNTITPIKDGCEFTPKNKHYSIPVTRNYDNESYKAAPITFEVSGSVMEGGSPVAGVLLQGLQGLSGNSTTTVNGTYTVKVPYRWNGSVTPVKEGYTFEPPVKSYTNVDTPMTGQDYSGSAIQYTISGTIGIEGVSLKGLPGNVVTGYDGQYTATVPHGWGQEVIPTLEGYTFDPPKRTYPKITQNQYGQDYTTKELLVTISGNAGQPGVILEGLEGPDRQPIISDGKGSYNVKVRFGWSGAVTPRKEGYVFKPEGKPYNRVNRDLLTENYTSSRMKCVISGMVGQPDVVMKGFPTRVQTAQNGAYNTTVDYDWNGEVSPEKGGYEFNPPSISYMNVKESQLNQDYTASEKKYKISGRIMSEQGPVEGIIVMTGLGSGIQSTTDYDGRYELEVPYNWRGTIQFLKEGYDFQPREQQVSSVTRDLTYSFTAKVKMLTITGEIIIDGQPTPGVTVTADNGGTTAITNSSGKYKIQVPYGWSGNVSPTVEGVEFDPPSKPYENVTQDIDETLGARVPTGPPTQQPSMAGPDTTALPSPSETAAPSTPGQPTTGPSTRPGRGPQAQQQPGINPEEELRQAKIAQLEKDLNDLKAGTPGTTSPAPSKMVEVQPGGMPPEGSKGPIIRLNPVEMDIREVLQNIATEADVTIVPDPEIGGNVSCNIPGRPLEEALDIVLAGSGFTWKKTPYYYLVTSQKLLSPGFLQGSETKRVKMSHIEAEMAVKLLSDAFKPYVQAQTAGRIVFITAPATLIERIENDLKKLDKKPRQVMLESKIVILEKGDLLNLGVEWGWPTSSAGVFGSDTHNIATDTLGDFAGKFPWGVQIGYSPDGTFTNALTMALNLLAENSEAKIMSNPQIFAQDGKKAEFSVLTEEYYMMTPPATAQTSNLYSLSQLETITSGTKLSITPYIGDDEDIVLEVAVELSDSIPKARGSDLPLVTRRITNNTVTVRDGGTVAIAGLTENRLRTKTSKVPGLGNLPLVGELFTSRDNDEAKREVAVFVTARLVRETGAYNPAPEPTGVRTPSEGRSIMEPSRADDFSTQIRDALGRRPGTTR